MRLKHPQATTLTTLLWSGRFDQEALETATYEALEDYFQDWSDEQKADLYALLAEKVKAHMTFSEMEEAVSGCLWDNLNNYVVQ